MFLYFLNMSQNIHDSPFVLLYKMRSCLFVVNFILCVLKNWIGNEYFKRSRSEQTKKWLKTKPFVSSYPVQLLAHHFTRMELVSRLN